MIGVEELAIAQEGIRLAAAEETHRTRLEDTGHHVIDIVAGAYCGAEIGSSPMAVVNERGPTSIVSDFGNNAGVIVGPEIADWISKPITIASGQAHITPILQKRI